MHTVEAASAEESDGLWSSISFESLLIGLPRVSLETGAMDAFAPARSLYTKFGFKPCPPFGQYVRSPTSACMTIESALWSARQTTRCEPDSSQQRRAATAIPEVRSVPPSRPLVCSTRSQGPSGVIGNPEHLPVRRAQAHSLWT
jgi:hypothetical protein